MQLNSYCMTYVFLVKCFRANGIIMKSFATDFDSLSQDGKMTVIVQNTGLVTADFYVCPLLKLLNPCQVCFSRWVFKRFFPARTNFFLPISRLYFRAVLKVCIAVMKEWRQSIPSQLTCLFTILMCT